MIDSTKIAIVCVLFTLVAVLFIMVMDDANNKSKPHYTKEMQQKKDAFINKIR